MYFQLDSNELCQINHIILILLHDFYFIMYVYIVVIFMSQNLWNGVTVNFLMHINFFLSILKSFQ